MQDELETGRKKGTLIWAMHEANLGKGDWCHFRATGAALGADIILGKKRAVTEATIWFIDMIYIYAWPTRRGH